MYNQLKEFIDEMKLYATDKPWYESESNSENKEILNRGFWFMVSRLSEDDLELELKAHALSYVFLKLIAKSNVLSKVYGADYSFNIRVEHLKFCLMYLPTTKAFEEAGVNKSKKLLDFCFEFPISEIEKDIKERFEDGHPIRKAYARFMTKGIELQNIAIALNMRSLEAYCNGAIPLQSMEQALKELHAELYSSRFISNGEQYKQVFVADLEQVINRLKTLK